MALTHASGRLGPPWDRQLAGTLDRLVVESDALADNPLADPARRPLLVYRAPGVGTGPAPAGAGVPCVYVLQAFLNQADRWLNRETFEPTAIEAIDARFSADGLPPALVVFVDAWTSLGGAQFIDSPGVGRYGTYVADEVTAFIDAHYPVRADPRGRGLAGHSSGGYGATVNAMLRPDRFGAFAARAGDALFEVSMAPEFPRAAKLLRDHHDGSLDAFLRDFHGRERFDYGRHGVLLTVVAAAAAYSPGPDGRPQLPFDPRTGRIVPEVWNRWLAWDPVLMAADHADALRGLRHVRLEAGRRDEANLDLGAQALSDELARLGVDHTFELYDGGHGGGGHRLGAAIAALVRALADA